MNDLISRQAAIDFIDAGHLANPNEPRWSDNEVVNFLKSRPSAQPERKTGRWTKAYERMDDLISRQAAIDTINRLDIPEDMCVFEILSHIELEIGTLPSAEVI